VSATSFLGDGRTEFENRTIDPKRRAPPRGREAAKAQIANVGLREVCSKPWCSPTALEPPVISESRGLIILSCGDAVVGGAARHRPSKSSWPSDSLWRANMSRPVMSSRAGTWGEWISYTPGPMSIGYLRNEPAAHRRQNRARLHRASNRAHALRQCDFPGSAAIQ
jgi:hypothetical protein